MTPAPAADGEARAAGSAPHVDRVLVLAAAMTVVGTALAVGLLLFGDLPGRPAVVMPWLALCLGFALAEVWPIHFEYRREAHTFSLSTVVLVIGLFTVAPLELVTARLVGLTLALVLHRRQAPFKIALNVSSAYLDTLLGLLTFTILTDPDPLDPRAWGAAAAAALVSDLASVAAVTGAVSLYQGRLEPAMVAPALLGLMSAPVSTSLGLVAVLLLRVHPGALALLGVVAGMLVISYRAYASLRDKHRSLEQLYVYTREMGDALARGRVLEALLGHTRELMHAERVWLYLPHPDGGIRAELTADGAVRTEVVHVGDPEHALYGLVQAAGEGRGRLLDVDANGILSPTTAGTGTALAAPLYGGGQPLGMLVVRDRSGQVRRFSGADLPLFTTVARHAGMSLENSRLVERLREEVAAKEHQALHDPLTGLPNRTLFRQRLEQALAVVDATAGPDGADGAAVLLIDLDRFKEVNDTLGHHNGDALLQEIAARLRAVVDEGDTVARLGGDEFAVLLPNARGHVGALVAGDAIRAAVERPHPLAEVTVDVGASIGIAIAPEHGSDPAVLLQRADVAMYTAKSDQSGVAIYNEHRDDHSLERLALVGELRWAIEQRELDVHYQPQVLLASGEIVGAEALLRWRHPRRGDVSPAEFVSVAEHTGLIRPLTLFVLERALRECAAWRRLGHELRVSVNLSARSLVEPNLVRDITALLRATGVPAHQLCLELTETGIMGDPRRAQELMQRLHALGVVLAIDDFGTGYSSLGRLTTLPVSEIKIDRSFVQAMRSRQTDELIVRSIIDLGRNLGMCVLAEGVEDEPTRQRLRQLGCEAMQGYVVSQPLPPHEFRTWLTAAVADGDVATGPLPEEAVAPVLQLPTRPAAG